MRIAILGGSFNPPHVGHLALAEDVQKTFGYDKILFIPALIPPHKTLAVGANDSDRVQMLELSIKGCENFDIELCEIHRGGISYTIDTIDYLYEKYKNCIEGKIGLIIGDDLVAGFSSWCKASELAEKTEIILARRNAKEVEDLNFCFEHKTICNAVLPISSSDVRERVKNKKSFRFLVLQDVYNYIVQKDLYGI